ncbi:MAG: DUF3617 domain-containing protein [Gammaproteobacteria bacterium]
MKMRLTMMVSSVLLLAAMSADASAGRNPVLDLSRVMEPGEWETTTTIGVNRRPQPRQEDTSCIRPEDVRDFLNQPDFRSSNVKHYKLEGVHLHFAANLMTGGKKARSVEYDMVFDSRVESHGRMKVVTDGKNAMTTVMEIRMHRTSACEQGRHDQIMRSPGIEYRQC